MDVLKDLRELPNKFPTSPQQLVNVVNTVPMTPYFSLVHFILVTLSLRKRSGSREYAQSHPFASWFVCVVACLGGSLISAFLLGKSTLHVFYVNNSNIILISVVWYFVLFSPFDVFSKIVNINLVKAILLVLKEVHRIRNIQNGVDTVASAYRGSSLDQIFFIAVLIGSVRGSGAKFMLRPLDSFIRGNIVSDNEFLQPTFTTKHSIVSSCLILLLRMDYIQIDEGILITALFVFAGTVQLAILLLDMEDPFKMMEKLFATVFLRLPNELAKESKKKKSD